MSSVLDASALLAAISGEPGSDVVAAPLAADAAISAVNLSEIVAKLAEAGAPEADIRQALTGLGLEVVAFDTDQAYIAGLMRPSTRSAGLSPGDRACLALAQRLGRPALTTDRAWHGVLPDVEVRVIR